MTNFQKQQDGFVLIGIIIAIAIIIAMFVYNNDTFFSGSNNSNENRAIYEEAKDDLYEIEQKNQRLNDAKQKLINDSNKIEQIYNKKSDIMNNE